MGRDSCEARTKSKDDNMLNPYPITGVCYASDSSTPYPDVNVTLRNTTKNSSKTTTTESDGSFAFDLANFIGGYADGDSLKLEGTLGSFYKSTTLTVDTSLSGLDTTLTLAVEEATNIIDFYRLKEELIVFLRQKLSDPKKRGDIKTIALSGTGSKVKFALPDTNVKAIHHVLVGDVLKSNYTDYYVEYIDKFQLSNPYVYFLTPPADGALVEMTYKHGSAQAEWIYPDIPRPEISLDNYPRVSVRIVGIRTDEGGLHADSNLTDVLGSVVAWSGKENELNGIIQEVRTLIMQNKKKFHYFKLIVPQGTGSMISSAGREEKILQLNQDFLIQYRLEVI